VNHARKPLIAGNWKMHLGGLAGIELAAKCMDIARQNPHVELVVAPPFTAIAAIAQECEEQAERGGHCGVAAQNMNAKSAGAYTGEVSPAMLAEAGATWVILGHSERRQHYGETDQQVHDKVASAFVAKLIPIVCVGETLEERESGQMLTVVKRQLSAFVELLQEHVALPSAIAYEPIWAIGTGKNAGPAEAEEVHAAIREVLAAQSAELAAKTRILYGGSVKADNAKSLLAAANVDGALVGGASLEAASFGAIARAAESLVVSS
jgi:triosephosphate isomerase